MKCIKSIPIFLLLIFLANDNIRGQKNSGNVTGIGLEMQVYPSGLIPGIRFEKGFADRHVILARVGYNVVRHGDAGKHDDERGGGPGFSLGYKYLWKQGFTGLFCGLKSDLWFNSIDWKDNIGTPNETMGKTEIVVLQPTAELGWAIPLSQSFLLVPALAFGVEINIKTEGSPTGEGAILLGGVTLAHRF